MTRWGRSAIVGGLMTVLLTIGTPGALAAVPAQQQPTRLAAAEDFTEGLRVESSTTYTVDLAASVIHVEHVATLTNQVPDSYTQSYQVQHYFDGYGMPVVVGATNLAASRDGTALTVTTEAGDEAFSWAVAQLRPNLFYGQTQTVRFTYDIPPQPPRSTTAAQVNQAFATFPLVAEGDPGLASVTFVVPEDLDVEVIGSNLQRTVSDGNAVYTATTIEDPATWWAQVVVRDDEALVPELVFFNDIGVKLLAWPGDTEWVAFTRDLTENGLPALRDLIGRPWAATGQLEIVETATPYLYGYGGWYQHESALIEVGDQLDTHTTLHEMSHAWFNGEMFDGRWISEAFADEYAALAMEQLGQERPLPEAVAPDDPTALPLNDWDEVEPTGLEVDEHEAYGYNTAWSVAHQLVGEVGTDAMAGVFDAAARHLDTYPAQTDDDPMPGIADWRVLLDLLEDVAGSAQAEQVFRDLVVGEADLPLLDERTAARAAYDDLAAEGDGWAPPAALRDAMAAWEYDDATAMMPQVGELFDARDGLGEQLSTIDVALPSALREQFETAGSLARLEAMLGEADDAAGALVAAVESDEGANPLAQVGLLFGGVSDELAAAKSALDGGDYDEAAGAARDASDAVAAATGTGALAVGGLVVLLAAGVVLVLWLRRRRARLVGQTGPVADGTGAEPAAEPTAEPATAVLTPTEPPLAEAPVTAATAPAEPAPDGPEGAHQ